MSEPLFHVHRSVTPAGLRLLVVPMGRTSTVTLMVFARTGSRDERAREWGISHFLEHLVFKGSKKRPTTRRISETLDAVGGELNAFTSKEVTVFHAKAAARHAALLADVLGDVVMYPLLRPREIERERGVIAEEIHMYEDTPLQSIEEYWENVLFGRHVLGRKIIGTKESVATLSRAALLAYRSRRYAAGNVVVCLAGNIGPEEGLALLRAQFRRFPAGPTRAARPFRNAWGRRRVGVRDKRTDQAHVVAGGTGVSYTHKDRSAVDLLAAILGGSMSSRLFLEVRERRGLAYAVRTSAEHFTDTGYVATQAGVDPAKLPDAVAVILAEYGKARTTRVPRAELAKARETLKGRLLIRLESSSDVAQFVGGQEVLTGRIVSVDDVFARLDAVTPEDIQRVAQTHLAPSRLRVAAIAPGRPAPALRKVLTRVRHEPVRAPRR